MTIGKKIALMLTGIFLVTLAAVGVFLTTAYQFSTSELSKTFKAYRGADYSTAIVDAEPFSVLLMGVDTGSGSRSDLWQGQSDSMIVVTVNPKTKKTTMTSLERDVLVELVDEKGEKTGDQAKLNAAYAIGGAPMAIKTVESLLDLKIDYYMQLNMQGLVDLVDAVGGITVTNDFDYPIRIDEWEPEYTASVEPGTHKVNGDQALVYSRMRYDDPEGDYGRQRRQRAVIQKIVTKLLALDGLGSYRKVLRAVSSNMQTDIEISSRTIPSLLGYRAALGNLKSYQLQGQDAELATGSYQAVTAEHMLETQTRLKAELGLPTTKVLSTNAILYEDLFGLDSGIETSGTTITNPQEVVIYEPVPEVIYVPEAAPVPAPEPVVETAPVVVEETSAPVVTE